MPRPCSSLLAAKVLLQYLPSCTSCLCDLAPRSGGRGLSLHPIEPGKASVAALTKTVRHVVENSLAVSSKGTQRITI